MKQFLMGAAVATAVLGAAGFAVMKEPVADAAVKKTVPLKLSDLTLDRLQRIPFSFTGGVPVQIAFPATYGMIVESFQVPSAGILTPTGVHSNMSVTVNGTDWGLFTVGDAATRQTYSPPLLIRPGDVVTLNVPNPGLGTFPILLTGWEVYPGEV